MKRRTVIFAGTTEGRSLSEQLGAMGCSHIVCVATDYGKEVMCHSPFTRIHVGRMDADEMTRFLTAEGFSEGDVIVDATHPYAVSASENIRKAADRMRCQYLRIRRDRGELSGGPIPGGAPVRTYTSMEECAMALKNSSGSLLLTTGSKELGTFFGNVPEEVKKRTYVRVLPAVESLRACLQEGAAPDHIIAMQGPFGYELNLALMRQYQIRHLVTKESGSAGGFEEKMKAARAAGAVSHVICRPAEETKPGTEETLDGILKLFAEEVRQNDSVRSIAKELTSEEERSIAKVRNSEKDRGADKAQAEIPSRTEEGERNRPASVILAGTGMGSPSGRTLEVREAIADADVVFGAERLLQGLQGKEKYALYRAEDIIPVLEQRRPQKAVILYSGDTGFFSGAGAAAARLREWDADLELRILPGISSVSCLAARLGQSYEDAFVYSLHGRNTDRNFRTLIREIRHRRKTFILLSGPQDLRRLAGEIAQEGIGCSIYAGSCLSGSSEKVEVLTPAEAAGYECKGPITAMVLNPDAQRRLLIPLRKDSAYVRDRVPMTKECVRHESIIRLSLRESDTMYDIGSGTGSVAVDAASLHPGLNVYAVEKKPEAASLIRENAKLAGTDNVTVIEGEAPGVLADLPVPDCVFIGGSGGRLPGIIDAVHKKGSGIRYVINAVSAETMAQIAETVHQYGLTDVRAVQLGVSELYQAGTHHLLKAQNPVFIVSFTL